MIAFIKKVFAYLFNNKDDPVKQCPVYKEYGCSHVDGFLCSMKTCSDFKNFKGQVK